MELRLEMGLSREDLLRHLPAALGVRELREEAGLYRGGEGRRRWTLRLTRLEDRRVGSLVLPCHRIHLHLEGFQEAEAEAFVARFHRAFQRGGG